MAEGFIAFNKTARGASHVERGIPCEDYSCSYEDPDGRFSIAVVADGHGDSRCFRSSFGSRKVAEITSECFKEFAESMGNITEQDEEAYLRQLLTDSREQYNEMQRIFSIIVSKWYAAVQEEFEENPPTEEELGENLTIEKVKENIPHVYGTTLIAALALPRFIILLQQGDGRCTVVYEDGSMDQPIPWDPRCEENVTTSMCDSDVLQSFRYCVINPEEKKVSAIFLFSDGVEDAYLDTYTDRGGKHGIMGGVYTFCKNLVCKLVENEQPDNLKEIFQEEYLGSFLPGFSETGLFSRSGSGDDVSVAGLVKVNELLERVEAYQRDIRQYQLEENLFWKKKELDGKIRKHGILEQRCADAKSEYDKVLKETNYIERYESSADKLDNTQKQLEENLRKAEEDLRNYQEECRSVEENDEHEEQNDSLKKKLKLMDMTIQSFRDSFKEKTNDKESKLADKVEDAKANLEKFNSERIQIEKKYEDQKRIREEFEKKYLDAKATFDEYDQVFQSIQEDCNKIQAEIDALEKNE